MQVECVATATALALFLVEQNLNLQTLTPASRRGRVPLVRLTHSVACASFTAATIMGFDLKQLFGLAPNAEEKNKEMRSKLRRMQRDIDGQIRDITRSTKTTEREIKQCAKRNDLKSCKALAKEIVHARQAVSKLYTTKARMNSVDAALAHQLAHAKSAKTLERSSEVLRAMNDLVKSATVRDQARELSKEMTKAGIMGELMDEALDVDLDVDEGETEAAIDEVLRDIVGEITLPDSKVGAFKSTEDVVAMPEAAQAQQTTTTTEDLKARLAAMREEA